MSVNIKAHTGVLNQAVAALVKAETAFYDAGHTSPFSGETIRQRGRLLLASAFAVGLVALDQPPPTTIPSLGIAIPPDWVLLVVGLLLAYQLVAFFVPAWGQRAAGLKRLGEKQFELRAKRAELLAHDSTAQQLEEGLQNPDRKALGAKADSVIAGGSLALQRFRAVRIHADNPPGNLTLTERREVVLTRLREGLARFNHAIEWWLPIGVSVVALSALWWWTPPSPTSREPTTPGTAAHGAASFRGSSGASHQ